jgi:hypothetical protein
VLAQRGARTVEQNVENPAMNLRANPRIASKVSTRP